MITIERLMYGRSMVLIDGYMASVDDECYVLGDNEPPHYPVPATLSIAIVSRWYLHLDDPIDGESIMWEMLDQYFRQTPTD